MCVVLGPSGCNAISQLSHLYLFSFVNTPHHHHPCTAVIDQSNGRDPIAHALACLCIASPTPGQPINAVVSLKICHNPI